MTLGLLIRDGSNVQRTISELVIRDGTNTPRTISELWIRDTNNIPRLVFNPSGSANFMVVATPNPVSGFGMSGTGVVTTDLCTATASLGTAPYTYAWTLIDYTAGTPPTANAPTSNASTFTQTGLAPFDVVSATFRVTATDANLNTAFTDITANFAESG